MKITKNHENHENHQFPRKILAVCVFFGEILKMMLEAAGGGARGDFSNFSNCSQLARNLLATGSQLARNLSVNFARQK